MSTSTIADNPIALTDAALEQARAFLAGKAAGAGIRMGVKGGGCAGYKYAIAIDLPADGDIVWQQGDVNLIVDTESVELLSGSSLDFVVEGLSGGFKFDNPNAAQPCGCGTSFKAKGQESYGCAI